MLDQKTKENSYIMDDPRVEYYLVNNIGKRSIELRSGKHKGRYTLELSGAAVHFDEGELDWIIDSLQKLKVFDKERK